MAQDAHMDPIAACRDSTGPRGVSMSETDPKREETYSEEETRARATAALQRMLATPHKPHKGEKKPKS
jgi:hypothetical protein